MSKKIFNYYSRHKISLNFGWSIFGAGVSQTIGLLVTIIVANFLGREVFGEYAILLSTISAAGVLAGSWLGIGATKFVAQYRESDPNRAGRIIRMSFFISCISSLIIIFLIIFNSKFIATEVLNLSSLNTLVQIISLVIVFQVWDGIQLGVLAGLEAFREIAYSSIIRSIVALPLTSILVYKWDLNGAVAAFCLLLVMNIFINNIYMRKCCKAYGIKVQGRFVKAEVVQFLDFSMPAIIGGLLGTPVLWFANILMVRQSNGYAEMALYSITSSWKNALLFIPKKLTIVALPVMSNYINSDKGNIGYDKMFDFTQMIAIAITLPATFILMFFGEYILSLYGDEYRDGYIVFSGMILVAGISGLGSGYGPAIQAKGKMWFGLAANVIWSITFISFVYTTIESYGAISLAYSLALAGVINLLITAYYLRGDLTINSNIRTTKYLIVLVSMTGAFLFLNTWNAFIIFLIFLLFYYLDIKNIMKAYHE
jgi:O-antigen/teichoic acid export membrane protein